MFSLKKAFSVVLSLAMFGAIAISTPCTTKADAATNENIGVSYSAHVQTFGWQKAVKNGATAGTTNKAKRLEAIKINLTGSDLPAGAKIIYKAHVQTYGWQKPVSNGQIAGTVKKGKRLEAIKITLSGLPGYAVQYRTYVQTYGWQPWVKTANGTAIDKAALSGTVNKAKRVEAIQIKLVKQAESWSDGEYEVGKDIPVGKYIVYPTDSSLPAYYKISSDTSGSFDSIISNDLFFGRDIIEVSDGQYLKIVNGIMYSEANAPAINNNGVYTDGMYEVGKDIPAGDYVITTADDYGYYEIATDCSHSLLSIVDYDFFKGSRYVTLQDWEYIKLSDCEMTARE